MEGGGGKAGPAAGRGVKIVAVGAVVAGCLAVGVLVGTAIGRGDPPAPPDEGSPLEEACSIAAGIDFTAPATQSQDEVGRLFEIGEAVDDEGLDPNQRLLQLNLGLAFWLSEGVFDAPPRASLGDFVDVCRSAGYSWTGPVGTDDASPPPPTTASTTTSSVPATTFGEREEPACQDPRPDRVAVEVAARCTYEAYRAGDQDLASSYADPQAIDELFATPWSPPEWTFVGCTPGDPNTWSCQFAPSNDDLGLYEFTVFSTPSAGASVSAFEVFG